ncbi:Dienelactone hydrolase [Desulfonatronum thiosulfatophilum]|uniref:Dienelactone hydrolase n=1 Tax=Desulfonatronum thiosulfatophilum TaxID=617002 RepID=A0A1G6E8I9_9BACT|nr:dienelactone hydrolase family protein [Desulfonatronum thiosulfatophilum]SDB53723.1 Dienelactone hydrolase [Desulfonatronum thiosulfatophilum]
MKIFVWTFLLFFLALPAHAEVVAKTVEYTIDGEQFEGVIIYTEAADALKPGILMVPNWMGPTEQSREKAARVAGDSYVVFMIDMYGTDIRPQDTGQARTAAARIREDRSLMRLRVNAALEVFKEQGDVVPLDTSRIAAIGFCFGGEVALELARSGTELSGVVSFHGTLGTADPADAQNIRTKILALHGADDPLVPDDQVQEFINEMREADVDWQMIHYGGAVHSFTDPYAQMPGTAEYHPVVARRAFAAMETFFKEIFQ